MESLSDLDDCINTLEKLQLTLDFETSTVKRNPKSFSPSESVDYSLVNYNNNNNNNNINNNNNYNNNYNYNNNNNNNNNNNRVDLVSSNQHRSDHDCYDIHLPDITKSSVDYKSETRNVVLNGEPQQNQPQLSVDHTDFKSLAIRRPKLTSNMSVDNELFSVPEFEVTDFPPPPPPIVLDSDNYLRNYSTHILPQQSPTNSSPSPTGNLYSSSNRKHSTNSLKLSPKPLLDPFSSNNNLDSIIYVQSNLSNSTEKVSRNNNAFPSNDTISEIFDHTKQTVVRFFSSDKTTKALIVNDKMTIEAVIKVLMEKNFWIPSLKSAIVEKVPSLKMERFFEEHEYLLDSVNSWPPTCSNMIFFEQRDDIYGLFENAKTNLGDNYIAGAMNVDAIKLLFYNLSIMKHDYQDYIYIKKPAENSWKRKFCLLNHNGIMTMQKKKSKLSKNQSNVMSFDERYFLYTTTGGWTKEWDAPTPFGFAFKPYSVVDPKSDQLLMFCASDEVSMKRWCTNLRLCKYKNQILNNYQEMQTRSIYCSNLYTADNHVNRTLSMSPAVYSKHSKSHKNSRCSLPTSSLGASSTHSDKFKF